jgi:NAD(P)-dependent dehydrogenase (short-subunit alcohol dehydrogenase family)
MLRLLARGGLLCAGMGASTYVRCSSAACSSKIEDGALYGKRALVFGGTSGIGLATVRALEGEGAEVIAISRDPSKASGEQLTVAACDVRDRSAVSATLAAHAPFDILVSAATGGERARGPFLSMDIDGYKGSFDKLWGYANVVQLGAPLLRDDGCIVLVSGAPARRPKQGQVALASVGAAVEELARSIAPELAPKRINVVSPGIIATPMFGAESEARSKQLASATAKNLIPRPGAPEEVASAILFVVKNRFVTGTTIDVDGGWLHGPQWEK